MQADAALRRNIRTILRLQGVATWRRLYVSLLYWAGVRKGGVFTFNYSEEATPKDTLVQRVRELVGLIRD